MLFIASVSLKNNGIEANPVFEITLNEILAMHASGDFDMTNFEQALSIAQPIARQIFQFYRQELEKRLI